MESNISTKDKTDFQSRIHLPQCQSTNDELLGILQNPEMTVGEGFVVSTDHQVAGRGQRGAVWESEAGQNLLFSLLLKPVSLPLRHAFWLSAALATGIALAVREFGVEVKVKWPNDLMVGDRKLGGILIENAASGPMLDRSVAGIGLNVNQTYLPEGACSLAGITGRPLDRETVLNRILESVLNQSRILRTEGWEKIRSVYYQHLFRMGLVHSYRLPDGTPFQAILKSISEEGQLVLLGRDGEMRFWFKEVVFDRAD